VKSLAKRLIIGTFLGLFFSLGWAGYRLFSERYL
jgi:hypothetical protein